MTIKQGKFESMHKINAACLPGPHLLINLPLSIKFANQKTLCLSL
jgi:hypothetical protein